jgi:hypothetical protein
VNTWRKPHLAANKKYIFSNSHLPVLENSKVIAPFFQSAKVPFGEGVGERYYLNANQLTRGELSGITGMFIALDLPLTVVSKNKKISSMHPMGPVKFSKMFEEIPSDLKTYIDLGDYDYPASLLSVLCAGKPVIARKNHFFKDELVKSVNTIAQLKMLLWKTRKTFFSLIVKSYVVRPSSITDEFLNLVCNKKLIPLSKVNFLFAFCHKSKILNSYKNKTKLKLA